MNLTSTTFSLNNKNIAEIVETMSNTSRYSKDDKRSLPVRQNENTIYMMKDEFDGKLWLSYIEGQNACV